MRRRILVLVVGMTTLVVLAFAIPLAVLIRNRVYDNARASLQTKAGQISLLVHSHYPAPTARQLSASLATLQNGQSASIELPTGRIIGQRPPGNLKKLPSPPNPGAEHHDGPPDGDHALGGPPGQPKAWADGMISQLNAFVPPTSDYIVRVYASDAELHSGEVGWWWLLAGASVGLLALGAAASEVLARRIVRPLAQTAATAQRLSHGDTTARAPTDGPGEVADVGRAMNRLADRIDQLIAQERETVADLSHRLRTPLTALRLDVEALDDKPTADRLGEHVTTLERLLTSVIRAARRPQREGRLPSCDATEVVDQRVQFWSALADDQARDIGVWLPHTPLLVRAGEEDLGAAVDALLENVLAHTPEGTGFTVRLTPIPAGGAELEVSDEGPGLPADAVIRGRSDRGSTGLGLDIARRCAESSGGGMTVGAGPAGGALITLKLGAP